jgi:spore coat protein CotH
MRNVRAIFPAGLLAVAVLLPGDEATGQPDFKKGPGMGGPGMGEVRKVVARFDKNGDGRLDNEERKAAREALRKEGGGGFGFGKKGKGGPFKEGGPKDGFGKDKGKGGFGKGGFFGKGREPGKPGPKVDVSDVIPVPASTPLYDPNTLRTFFLTFENADWEEELADFYRTDVEVPATLVVDGKTYKNVGVHFRGTSSYFMTPSGSKRSLNLSLDFVDKKQRLLGHKTVNLLNGADDPSFLHTVLYSHISRQYIPTPRANLAKVVINGESWGIYTNVEQFNKDFLKEFFDDKDGTRWKAQGSPGGRGGLEYLGEDDAPYRRIFKLKSNKDDPKAWKALINLCKVLNETPPEDLEQALKPILNIEGALWFLALDVALINNDGYWTRASDYTLYLDKKGRFHVVPHDMNESFGPAGGFGFGFGGGGGGGGVRLDPLTAGMDSRKPLRTRLLGSPALKKQYLEMIRKIADEQLDWKKLGPVVASYRKLIEKEVEADTRKLYPLSAFRAAVSESSEGSGREMSLKAFCDQRRKFLLEHPEVRKLAE